MKPENANLSNFKVDKLLLNNGSFSIALGMKDSDHHNIIDTLTEILEKQPFTLCVGLEKKY